MAREGIQVLQPHGVSLYRYGGEEFAVVFTEDSLPGAIDLMEEWRQKVAQRSWREQGLHVTFSGGFSEWSMEPLDQLINTVDEALYKAKQQGKNQILRSSSV